MSRRRQVVKWRTVLRGPATAETSRPHVWSTLVAFFGLGTSTPNISFPLFLLPPVRVTWAIQRAHPPPIIPTSILKLVCTQASPPNTHRRGLRVYLHLLSMNNSPSIIAVSTANKTLHSTCSIYTKRDNGEPVLALRIYHGKEGSSANKFCDKLFNHKWIDPSWQIVNITFIILHEFEVTRSQYTAVIKSNVF